MSIKTVLIIGARSDIAYELILNIAKTFQPEHFLLTSKKLDSLENTANDLNIRTKIPMQNYALDMENLEACEIFYDQLPQKPELVIYCAGYLGEEKNAESDAKEATKVLNINYTGAMILLEKVATDMAQKKQGMIVGISSIAGLRGRKKNYHYGAAKAAFLVYLSGLRNRLFSDNVHVMTVLPGFVDTKMTKHLELPKALTATPQQAAEAIMSGIRRKKDVIYVKKIWRLIMWIIGNIPEKIFKRLDL